MAAGPGTTGWQRIDWAWRGVTETARVARSLVAAYYGRPQQKSYFAGCSTGGRMGLMAAQRFPADFDGIIAGAPALDYSGLVATHGAWVTQANLRPDGSEILDRSKVALDRRGGRSRPATHGTVEPTG